MVEEQMTITRTRLVEMAAEELLIASVGQSLAVEDAERIDARLDGLLDNLNSRGIIYLGDSEAIPEAVANAVSILLADNCAVAFGQPRKPAEVAMREDELRVISRRMTPTKKYLTVDDALKPSAGYTYQRFLNDT